MRQENGAAAPAGYMLLLALAGQACASCTKAPAPAAPPVASAPAQQAAAPMDLAAIDAAVDSPARPAADRELDAARKPREMLRFFGIQPGMKILELFAVSGWYAELESRVVGPTGEVYAQNPPQFIAQYGDKKITERLAGDRLPNVRRWDRSIDALALPAEHFDGAVASDVLHDFFWLSANVDGVLGQIYRGLKPGGFFAVVDHAAPAGTGDSYARDYKGKHRIDEEYVKRSVTAAGFRLEAESQLLRNPDDDRTRGFFEPEMKGKNTDKFALLFRKPL
jgi:predicted methyltransferase